VSGPVTLYYKDNKIQDLLTEAQAFTGAWANLGPLISGKDTPAISLWLKYLIGDSTLPQLRLVGRRSLTDTEDYSLPIRTINAFSVDVAAEVFSLPAEDTTIALPVETSDLINYMQVQVKVATAGAIPGSFLLAQVLIASKGRTV